jgi:hypothetical protein
MGNSTCNSTHAVYIIKCCLCNIHYVGQSTRKVKVRIGEHLSNIRNANLFRIYKSDVAKHFSNENHNLKDHFKFIIYNSGILDDHLRKSKEADLINICKSLDGNIINDFIPDLFYTKDGLSI